MLRFLAQPGDVNFGGRIHGGAAMKWMDQAGYTCATRWSNRYCVTAFVGDINFGSPIAVGDLVEVRASVIRTGRTSMWLAVDVDSADPRVGTFSHRARCIMVFVAVDGEQQPVGVPPWIPERHEDIALEDYASRVMALRRENRQALSSIRRHAVGPEDGDPPPLQRA